MAQNSTNDIVEVTELYQSSSHAFEFSPVQPVWEEYDGLKVEFRIQLGGQRAVMKGTFLEEHCVVAKLSHDRTSLTSEQQILHKLQGNPYIPIYRKYYSTTTVPCLVMDFVEGHTLRQLEQHYMTSAKNLDLRTLVKLLLPLANAIKSLHAVDVIHGDLSMSNIMFTQGPYVIKLIDFGNSRLSSVQGSGARRYTRRFAAPELLRGERVTFKTDIWAFGKITDCLLHITTATDNIHIKELACACMHVLCDQRPSARDVVNTLRAMWEGLM